LRLLRHLNLRAQCIQEYGSSPLCLRECAFLLLVDVSTNKPRV
jgi:hypothetical protein